MKGVRELLRVLRALQFPLNDDENVINEQLAELRDNIWAEAVTFVEANHELIQGMGSAISRRAKYLGEPFGMSELELREARVIKEWLTNRTAPT